PIGSPDVGMQQLATRVEEVAEKARQLVGLAHWKFHSRGSGWWPLFWVLALVLGLGIGTLGPVVGNEMDKIHGISLGIVVGVGLGATLAGIIIGLINYSADCWVEDLWLSLLASAGFAKGVAAELRRQAELQFQQEVAAGARKREEAVK